ncbi:MAG: adenylate/guanylate cyclase domain-containing protein [Actinomycetota bacterium]
MSGRVHNRDHGNVVSRSVRPRSPAGQTEDTALAVVLFEDMVRSTAIKRAVTKRADEHTYQELRKEHDALLTEIVTRDGAGRVVKWTGDGLIALFRAPSLAVERAVEIQDRLHPHPQIKARIGIDMGEVRIQSERGRATDVFGAHVDGAARVMSLGDGGHICVTAPVYRDAFSWITKSKIAWKRHGLYRAKPGEPPYEVYQPYNANRQRPMRKLRGEKVEEAQDGKPPKTPMSPPSTPPAVGSEGQGLQIIRPWEAVARDGRQFAETGAGIMYWFKVPLGGLSYPDGFRHFLQPALENDRVTKIRFVLDSANPAVPEIWNNVVLPLARQWGESTGRSLAVEEEPGRGSIRYGEADGTRQLAWVFVDLSSEFTPCFKLFVDDPDSREVASQSAQIFLSTAARIVRLPDGSQRSIRIPDAVLRVKSGGDDALLHALNAVANQWDSLFW